jgi:long-chain fatty acid transport protein
MNAPITKFVSGLGLCALLCAVPTTTEAVYAGVKSLGRMGAVMASPVDSFTVAYNPAGLSWVEPQLNVGGHLIYQKGQSQITGNDVSNGSFDSHANAFFVLPEIGACQHYYQKNWTIGIVAYTRDFLKTDYSRAFPQFGTSKLELEYEHETISPAFAIKFGRYHSLGVSVDLMVQRLRVNGLQNFANSLFSHHPSKVTNKGYDYSFGVGVTVGWTSHFWDCATLSLAYSPAISMSDFNKYKGLLAGKGHFHIPERYMIGLAINILKNWVAEVDAELVPWNKYPALDHSLDEIYHIQPFGRKNGVGLGWRDQVIWRMGTEYTFLDHCIALRLGYQHSRSPVRGSQTFFNLLTPNLIEDWVSIGMSWDTCWIGEFSFYTTYGFENNAFGSHSIPCFLGGGNANLKESRVNFGLAWTKYY